MALLVQVWPPSWLRGLKARVPFASQLLEPYTWILELPSVQSLTLFCQRTSFLRKSAWEVFLSLYMLEDVLILP